MVKLDELSRYCIYTMRERNHLDYAYSATGIGTFSERRDGKPLKFEDEDAIVVDYRDYHNESSKLVKYADEIRSLECPTA